LLHAAFRAVDDRAIAHAIMKSSSLTTLSLALTRFRSNQLIIADLASPVDRS
jgi:hypothetical protein